MAPKAKGMVKASHVKAKPKAQSKAEAPVRVDPRPRLMGFSQGNWKKIYAAHKKFKQAEEALNPLLGQRNHPFETLT